MTERRIEELAAEVAAEISANLAGFEIDHVEQKYRSLSITFSWKEPFRVEVSIDLHEYATDESIKKEIRRQLQEASPAAG